MKKFLTLCIILTVSLFLFGCGSQNSNTSGDSLNQELVGTWENTQNVDQGNQTAGNKTFTENVKTTYVFNEDGSYSLKTDTDISYNDGTTDTNTEESSGYYSLDGDKLTTTAEVIEGMTEEESIQSIQNSMPSAQIDESGLPAYQPVTLTIKIDGDKLTIDTPNIGSTEYTRVNS